jgi:hypothetical protein
VFCSHVVTTVNCGVSGYIANKVPNFTLFIEWIVIVQRSRNLCYFGLT